MDGTKPFKVAGVEVSAEERTPLVDHLLRVIEELRAENKRLRDEIDRLKGLPPRPTIRPSTLNAPHPDPSHKKRRRGKRPGSAKRQKTAELIIHETVPVPLEGLPEGTRQNGYEDFVVQDLKLEAHTICYRRLRYLLPDGTSRTAPLPAHVRGHFGPGLRELRALSAPSERRHAAVDPRGVAGLGDRHLDRPDRPRVDREVTTRSTRRKTPCCRRRVRCRAISRPTTPRLGTWAETLIPR